MSVFFSSKLPWQKGIFNSSLAPTPMAPKEMSFSCFGLQICRVIAKKIVERALAVMDQGKKLCSLDHEIFIDALPCVSLLFCMDFQEIDPYTNPIKSTICIGNASWVSPRFCRPYMLQGSFERQVNLWMCLGHRRAKRVVEGHRRWAPKSSYKWGEISINNHFKWPKINGFAVKSP